MFLMAVKSDNILQWNCKGLRGNYEELCALINKFVLSSGNFFKKNSKHTSLATMISIPHSYYVVIFFTPALYT